MKLHLLILNRLIVLFCIVLTVCGAEAKADGLKIYVAVTGNDLNPGTRDQPLAGLNGAVARIRTLRTTQQLTGPVEVIIGNGEYFMAEPVFFGADDSGSEQSPVLFKPEEGAHPVFIGGRDIKGFEKVSETLWRTKIPGVPQFGWYFEQLYVNGKRARRAASPNHGFYFLRDVAETVIDKGTGRTADLAVQKFKLFPDGVRDVEKFSESDFDDAVMILYHKWDNTRKRVASFSKDSAAVYTVGGGMKPWNTPDKKTRYTLENYRAALDTCGEWYLDRTGYLYYMPCQGESPENLKVTAPVTGKFIVIQGNGENSGKVGHIRFEGLSFKVAGYKMPATGNEPAQAAHPVEAAVMADFAHHIQLVNCEIAHTGTNGVWFRNDCSDCRIEKCYFHDLGAGGVKIGNYTLPVSAETLTRNIVVDNNIIRSGGFVFPCAVGVTLFHASDNQVTHNEIADFRYSGVSVGWIWGYADSPSKRNKIEFNQIHHLGWGELCDMGGVYCLGKSEGTTVSNNVVHHVYSFDYGGWGLYTDEGSTGIIMENNLVYNCKSSGFHQHYGEENIIRNNIFANNLKAQLQATRIEDHLSFTFSNNIIWFTSGDLLSSNWGKVRLASDNNCYWDTRSKDIRFGKLSFGEWKKSLRDVHSISADPGFLNPSAFDFRIRNKGVLRKIGFKEFDYSKAGVYGSDEWVKLAAFDPAMAARFDQAVERNEGRSR